MRSRPLRAVIVVLASTAATACAALLGIEDTRDESPLNEAGTDVRGDRALIDAPSEGNEAGIDAGKKCPTGDRGPAMVLVNETFCIDATEVTNVQYKKFIDARAGDAGGQPPECKFSTTHLPYATWPYPTGKEDFPVPDVTWCSARAFCEWAGKRLCGAPGTGAPVKASDVANSTTDEWFAACSHNGDRAYPYGDTFSPTACNGREMDAGAVVKVRSKPACDGGYAGIFDMSGNAEEWDNACEKTTTVDAGEFVDVCYTRGGNYDFALSSGRLACKSYGRLYRGNHAGIRCCATPTPN